MKQAKNYFGIQLVAEITGISIFTLRAWEKRYQLLVPERTPTGRRLYSQADIQKLLVVKALVQSGAKIKDVAGLPRGEILKLLNSSRFRHLAELPHWRDQEVQTAQTRELLLAQLLSALENFDIERIHHEFSKLALSTSPKILAMEIFSPLLRHVGEMTANERLSIAHEHALSALIDRHLNSYLNRASLLPPRGPRGSLLLTTPPGEQHAFGIKLASLICQEHGWGEYNLGTQLPLSALVLAVQKFHPQGVIIGVAAHYSRPSRRQSALLSYLAQLRQALPARVHLIVGGPNLQWRQELSSKQTHFFCTLNELDQFCQFAKRDG